MKRTLACPTDESLKNLLKGHLTGPLVELLASHLENCTNCTKRAEHFRLEDDYATLLRKEKEHQLSAQEAQELADLRMRMLSLKETLTNSTNPTLVNPGNNRDTPRELRSHPSETEAAPRRGNIADTNRSGKWLWLLLLAVGVAVAVGVGFWLRG
jgi:hypothetical protein